MRRCVRSRNLANEEALAHWGLSHHKQTGLVQWCNPVVETSVGEPLISMRPFTVAKCSAWLHRNNATVFEAPSLVALKSATIPYFPLLSSSPYNTAHKTKGLHKRSVPNIMGRLNKRAGMSACMSDGQVSTTGDQ